MSIDAKPTPNDPIAALAGEAFAKAVTTLARGHMLTPFGVARSTPASIVRSSSTSTRLSHHNHTSSLARVREIISSPVDAMI